MTSSQTIQANAIIHTASVAAAGVATGMAFIPCSDNAVIVPIQVTAIFSLAKVFDVKLSEAGALALLTAASTGVVGRAISQWLVGWWWGIGNIVNAATAAGVTEAALWACCAKLEAMA
jgi:uncharacterized protein (DUF697 family)